MPLSQPAMQPFGETSSLCCLRVSGAGDGARIPLTSQVGFSHHLSPGAGDTAVSPRAERVVLPQLQGGRPSSSFFNKFYWELGFIFPSSGPAIFG